MMLVMLARVAVEVCNLGVLGLLDSLFNRRISVVNTCFQKVNILEHMLLG